MNSPADNGSDREKQLRLAKRDFIREMAVEAELQYNDAERAYNAFITTVLVSVTGIASS
ncbi:hypothetical protein [Propionicicella superfundia]|uniref:hypothetical protein n=1 Tax=Propionicicella superfundia TaxID=348582 RepID=UPI0012EC40C4|nr:hypothetical protein [Propionicicella superfundia]